MRIPKPLTIAIVTFLFPVVTSIGYFIKLTTVGEACISMQVAFLAFQIQKYFWSDEDYHAVKRFLFRGK